MPGSKIYWERKQLAGYCQICGEEIWEMVFKANPCITVNKWNCEHQEAVRVVKK